MKKSTTILMTAAFWLCAASYGQGNISLTLPDIVPVSPEAAAIAKYINYPVDYSTGLAKIEIPLYEIKAGGLTLPVTLSYHASGIKANENAGWIGLGWTLHAEPMVSRSVKGNPDERNQTGLLDNNSANWNDGNYLKMLVDGGRDEQPDDFYYRLPDKSGGFIFKKDVTNFSPHSLVLHPYEPVKIDFNRTFPYKFEITDESGVYYRFGISLKDEPFLEYSESPDRGQNLTGWKGTEIISANKRDTISFSYTDSKETITGIADYITVEDSLIGAISPSSITDCARATFPFIIQNTHGATGFNNSYIINQAGELESFSCDRTRNNIFYTQSYIIYGKKIKQIHFRGGRVEFETEPTDHYLEPERWVKLKSIKVFDSNNSLVKEISFHRSFFGVINSSSADFTHLYQRDRLDEIAIRDHAGKVVERYKFGYSGTSLPASLTNNIDHWGYYNAAGNPENESAVPVCTVDAKGATIYGFSSPPVSFRIGRANKEPNETAMQYGILNSITYPAGGSTTFTYQPHKYMENGVLKNSGGLRIASIRDYDPESGQSTYQIFRYGKNGNGAGLVRWNISPGDYMYQQENYYMDLGVRTRHRTYYCSTLSDLFYANGSTVVYDEVTVYRSNSPDAAGTLGKTVYTFDQSRVNYYKPYRVGRTNIFIGDRTGWMHGKLLREAVLHQNGDTLSTTTYRYAAYREDMIQGGIAYRNHNLIGEDHNADLHESIQRIGYSIYTGSLRPKSVKKTDRFSSAKVETNREYEYSGTSELLYPAKMKTTTSEGVTVTDQYKYPLDMTGLSGDAEAARQKLISSRQINALMEHQQTKGSMSQIMQTEYAVVGNAALPKLVKANTGKNQAMETRIRYYSYDGYGNPACVSYEDGPMIVYIWGYKGRYPVAKIESTSKEGSFYNTVINAIGSSNITTLSGSPTDAQVKNIFANLRSNSALGALVTSYTYKPLVGMTSETDPSGRRTEYVYDDFGRLLQVKDENGQILKDYQYNYKQ
jgi:YD repeat-containing protein